MLTAREERLLLDLVMLCQSTKKKSDFDSAQKVLSLLLPHTKCFAGIISTRNKKVKYHINYGFKNDFIQHFLLDHEATGNLLFGDWLKGCSPIFIKLGSYKFPQDCRSLKQELSKSGVQNIMAHGMLDISKLAASYIIFTDIKQWDNHTKHIVKTVIPIIHSLIGSIYFNENRHISATCNIALTNREREILHWISQGKTNVEIGIILSISHWTVKVHTAKILKKFNATTRSQAVTTAINMNLIIPTTSTPF